MRSLLLILLVFLYLTPHGLFSQSGDFNPPDTSYYLYFEPEIRILINQPKALSLDPEKPLDLIIYALPNGNTIEQTFGKKTSDSLEWRYEIQHIGAQTRMLREISTDKNIILVLLEAKEKSFPSWRRKFINSWELINSLIDSLRLRFKPFSPDIILTGHSGGGSFIFGFINYHKSIPSYVRRISFLDSNYGYTHEEHYLKLVNWLNSSQFNFLSVIAYDDREIELDGKKVVSPTGGTFRRTQDMKSDFQSAAWLNTVNDSVIEKTTSSNLGIELLIHLNPKNLILHTVLVEKNGFLHAMLSGTRYPTPFRFFGDRAYSSFILP